MAWMLRMWSADPSETPTALTMPSSNTACTHNDPRLRLQGYGSGFSVYPCKMAPQLPQRCTSRRAATLPLSLLRDHSVS